MTNLLLRLSRGAVALLLLCAAVSIPARQAGAQRLGPAPKRPPARVVADTNDWLAYLDAADKAFDENPELAAAAFYWAARINPASPDALYGRRAALILSSRRTLDLYMDGTRRSRENSRELRALDSLLLKSFQLSPFLYRKLDHRMWLAYIRRLNSQGSVSQQIDTGELMFLINQYLTRADAGTKAFVAYNEGSFADALRHYATLAKEERNRGYARLERARIFGMKGEADSAVAEFEAALAEARKKDKKEFVVIYESKAINEYAVGVLLEGQSKDKEAREAYGRAIQEDLAFYPAHLRLGMMAVAAKDTAGAIAALDLAAQTATNDPYVHFMYGSALSQLGKAKDGIAQLQKAVEAEPLYALPHYGLGRAHEQLGDKAAAVAAYGEFLKRASQRDQLRSEVDRRLTELRGSER